MSHPTLQRDRQGVDYGEQQNVQKLHAAVRREKRGGRVTVKPFSLWMLVILGIVFFFAGFFSVRHGSDFTATNVDRGNPAGSPVDSASCSNRALLLPAPPRAPSQTPARRWSCMWP
jgi:hypothetical protein